MNNDLKIRFAQEKDLPRLVSILNQAIFARVNGSLEEFTIDDRKAWFNSFNSDSFPIYVAEINTKVVGYCYLSPYRSGRQAMSKIAEISYYVDYDHHSTGIGSALIQYAISDCKRIGKDSLLAILLDINEPSIRILKKFNFKQWGFFPNIIDLENKICSQIIFGLKIE